MAKKKSARTRDPHTLNFAAIEANYRTIEDRREATFAACETDAQRSAFHDTYNAARDAYWAAVAARLEDNNDFVKSIRKDLQDANKNVKAELQSLQDIARALALLAEATRLAASLVTLAKV